MVTRSNFILKSISLPPPLLYGFNFFSRFSIVVQSLCHAWLSCNPMGCSPPGSSVHGISQARILEWVAISFSKYMWISSVQLLSHVQLLCDPVDCSLPGSSAHGISQARILERVAISFSRGSSQPKDRTCISCIGRWILYHWATWETQVWCYLSFFL